ncbi:benzoylformate decarboxylase [Burkholderia lata]|uniref:Benzoylformate decarboxylase n=1 Tax=Burkholderia lata (strain ATCC 17760 / DSM 23089 / LMG 22485 / NCIMB 9086 / R18194 / 383) TaxID=482957 RepID=A0A6P2RQD3_BURL3|nr:thiamine pyrophosphate-binding protein [Burkholderia lata]VWC37860.1 benzoylformate decarboxylase [Burkholderia lata]
MGVNQRRSSVANGRAGIDTSLVALIDVEHRGGAAILVDVLRGEGARNVLGNFGTTQLLFIDVVTNAPNPSFTFGMQNITVDAIADGYVHDSGISNFTSSYTVADLSHAMGAPRNLKAARTPLIINATPHDSRHAFAEPLLHGNLLGVTRPAVRWALNVSHPTEIVVPVRRAFNDSGAARSETVFLSVLTNVAERTTSLPVDRRSAIGRTSMPTALPQQANALTSVSSGCISLVVGDEVFGSGASVETVAIADPTSRALWLGNLLITVADILKVVRPFDTVFVLGDQFSISMLYPSGPVISPKHKLNQLASDSHDLGRTHATELTTSITPMNHVRHYCQPKVMSDATSTLN